MTGLITAADVARGYAGCSRSKGWSRSPKCRCPTGGAPISPRSMPKEYHDRRDQGQPRRPPRRRQMARLLRLVRPFLLGARIGARPRDPRNRRLSARDIGADRRRPLWRRGGARSRQLQPRARTAQGGAAAHRAPRDATLDAGGRPGARGGLGRGLGFRTLAIDPRRAEARFILRCRIGDTYPWRF